MRNAVVAPVSVRCSVVILEPLEARQLCSVSLDANGFTVVSPDANSRVIYVSASQGSDQNSGLSATSPVATLARGESLLRNNSADQLLLKAGDTWTSTFSQWTKSGENAQHPMLVGSYGVGARPLILTGDIRSAFYTAGSTPVNDLVISGLQFKSDVRNPASANFSVDAGHNQDSGFRWYAPTDDLLLQDCSFQYYSDNIDIEGLNGSITGVSLTGDQSLDSYTSSGGTYRSQGLYGYNLNGISITQSLFDHDGWNDTVPGAGRSGYDHDIYLSSTVLNASIQNNIIANASNNGLLARGGGDIENNLFLDNPSAISYGASPGSMSALGGVHGDILNNVILGDASLGSLPYGFGITIANTAPGTQTLVANNLFTGDTQQSKPAIELTAATDTKNPADCVGINDLVIQNNLFNNWYRPLEIESSLQPGSTGISALNDVVIRDNNFQNAGDYLVRYDAAFSPQGIQWDHNTYTDTAGKQWFELDGDVMDLPAWKAKVDSTAVDGIAAYPNANATEATYDASIGGAGTSPAFIADERAQNQASWNPALSASAVNDYLRAGFGLPTNPIAVATAETLTDTTLTALSTGPSPASEPYTFTVTYQDTQALDDTTIANGNVAVTGPGGFNQLAALVGLTPGADGKSAVATYAVTPVAGDWAGTDDGAYSIVMQPNQVRNSAGLSVQSGAIGQFDVALPLIIDGTAGNDRISARVLKQNLVVTVNRQVLSYPITDVPELEIYTLGGNDRVSIAAGVVPTMIQAGSGNDVIQTANGNDTLLAGSGNDILSATAGHDILIGGPGRDQLISRSGSDLLLGGTGKSLLRGGIGDDVLISGGGANHLQAGRGNQLLISGVPSTEDPTALTALLNTWANGEPFAAKVSALAPANGGIGPGHLFSLAGISFSSNPSASVVIGGVLPDWLVLDATDHLLHKTALDVITTLP